MQSTKWTRKNLTNYVDDIKKIAILKNGIGIKGQKSTVCKIVGDQRNGAQVL